MKGKEASSYRRDAHSIVADAFFKLGKKTSRYSKNKVLFTVPWVYARAYAQGVFPVLEE